MTVFIPIYFFSSTLSGIFLKETMKEKNPKAGMYHIMRTASAVVNKFDLFASFLKGYSDKLSVQHCFYEHKRRENYAEDECLPSHVFSHQLNKLDARSVLQHLPIFP